MTTADVVIAGGGFVGMAAAAALAGEGRRVIVIEARAGVDPRFRGELIHPRGAAVLSALGLRAPLARAGAAPVDGFAVVPGGGRPAVLLPYDAESEGAEPPRGLTMEHQAMVACLRDEVASRPGVELRTGEKVTGLLHAGGRVAGVTTASGERIAAELTVVAEGRHSKLRGLLGIDGDRRLLSFTAALLLDGAEVPHGRHGHVFLGAGGPVLAYPVGGRVRMCVDLPVSAERGPGAIAALLREAYAPFVPEPLRSAMLRAAAGDDVELCANHAIHTRRCAAPGVVLAGDAGGCCHPLTATGLTTGLNDVRILADEMARGPTVDAALLRYQRRRYRFVRARELLADALYEVFRGTDDGTRAIRTGIIRHWQGSARARAATMALLSGEESRPSAFLAEYLRVVGRAAYGVLGGEAEEPTWSGRAASLSELFRTSYAKLGESVATVYEDAVSGAPVRLGARGLLSRGRARITPVREGAPQPSSWE